MRNLSELFEYLTNCENETMLKEIKIHKERLIRQEGSKATIKFKLDIEKYWYGGNHCYSESGC